MLTWTCVHSFRLFYFKRIQIKRNFCLNPHPVSNITCCYCACRLSSHEMDMQNGNMLPANKIISGILIEDKTDEHLFLNLKANVRLTQSRSILEFATYPKCADTSQPYIHPAHMTFSVTHTPEFDIPFHMVRQPIRCLFRIIEYFMNTECPWLVVQGDCNLHKWCGNLCSAVNVTRATTNKANTIVKKVFRIDSVSNANALLSYAKPLYVLATRDEQCIGTILHIFLFIYLSAFIVHGHFSIFTYNAHLKLTTKTNKLITLLVII